MDALQMENKLLREIAAKHEAIITALRSQLAATEAAEKRVAELEAEIERLRAEARRFYRADGSFVEMEPEQVVEQRRAAAALIEELAGALRDVLECFRDESFFAPDVEFLDYMRAALRRYEAWRKR